MNADRNADAYPDPATVRPSLRARRAKSAATALGWFSIGLGLAEILWPRRVSGASPSVTRSSSVSSSATRRRSRRTSATSWASAMPT